MSAYLPVGFNSSTYFRSMSFLVRDYHMYVSVGSAGPAFIQRQVHVYVCVRSLIIMHVGTHYVMFIIGEDLYLAMF